MEGEEGKTKQLRCSLSLQRSLLEVPVLSWWQEDPGSNAIVTGSPTPGSAKVDRVFPTSTRIGSMASMVNRAGQNEPAWEQLGEVEVEEMRNEEGLERS